MFCELYYQCNQPETDTDSYTHTGVSYTLATDTVTHWQQTQFHNDTDSIEITFSYWPVTSNRVTQIQ